MKVVKGGRSKAVKQAFNASDILELHIVLRACEPKVERTLVLRADHTFADLHGCIQIAMGWENAHLHEFRVGDVRVGMDPQDEFFADADVLMEEEVRLFQLLPECKGSFTYWYDFGDDWFHDIKINVLPLDKYEGLELPSCTAGSGACPPEDCGGVWGYAELLEGLQSGSLQRKKEIHSWLGGPFDPTKFDLKAVDRALRS
jgi:Plasmid pRiA4b ORF-3-like protein